MFKKYFPNTLLIVFHRDISYKAESQNSKLFFDNV